VLFVYPETAHRTLEELGEVFGETTFMKADDAIGGAAIDEVADSRAVSSTLPIGGVQPRASFMTERTIAGSEVDEKSGSGTEVKQVEAWEIDGEILLGPCDTCQCKCLSDYETALFRMGSWFETEQAVHGKRQLKIERDVSASRSEWVVLNDGMVTGTWKSWKWYDDNPSLVPAQLLIWTQPHVVLGVSLVYLHRPTSVNGH
jgi:hypothetical protein